MDAKTYQFEANKTAADNLSDELREANVGLGLAGEALEIIELFDDSLTLGQAVHRQFISKELGDVQWYLARACLIFGHKLEDIDAAMEPQYQPIPLLGAIRIGSTAKTISEAIKKHLTHGHMADEAWHAKIRMAMVQLNLACFNLANSFGLSMVDIRIENIEKLHKRYPGGKFTTAGSLNHPDESQDMAKFMNQYPGMNRVD